MHPTQYDSFNARNHTPQQVAETFVPNEDYRTLWRNEHTVVLGPRGSGKTTLFKMLTVQALYAWDDPYATALRQQRPFTAVYLPADMHWHHQLRHAERTPGLSQGVGEALSRAAVTNAILLALARTFQERLTYEAPTVNANIVSGLCTTLVRLWSLPNVIPCLDGIVLALRARTAEIRQFANRIFLHGCTDAERRSIPDYYNLDYLSSLFVACAEFDQAFRLPQSPKWALCLDELELAPSWLQDLALSQMRSTEENALIKISTSPLPLTLGTTGAAPRHDFRLLTLWNHSSRGDDRFSEELASAVITRRLGSPIAPSALFGSSRITDPDGQSTSMVKYQQGSAEWVLFRDLATWDKSFRNLLVEKNIDPTNPVCADVALRDSVLRKARPIALLREAFLKGDSPIGAVGRSRKLATVYYGREAIWRIADGNPRRLIGILDDLLARAKQDTDGKWLAIPENEQADTLRKASAQFVAYVKTLPEGSMAVASRHLDLFTILQTVAAYFRRRLLGTEFPLDPIGSFKVDSSADDQLLEVLRVGVYHGALVHVDPLPDSLETNIRGKRFRLSFMLSPVYRLPLTVYDPISLDSILKASERIRVRRARLLREKQMSLPVSKT
ncbi:MAG: hypothetical protein WBP56_04455 [Polyangia bacterium]